LKRQDPDMARIRQVQKYIIIIFKFEKYISNVENQNIMNHNIRTEIIFKSEHYDDASCLYKKDNHNTK